MCKLTCIHSTIKADSFMHCIIGYRLYVDFRNQALAMCVLLIMYNFRILEFILIRRETDYLFYFLVSKYRTWI